MYARFLLKSFDRVENPLDPIGKNDSLIIM